MSLSIARASPCQQEEPSIGCDFKRKVCVVINLTGCRLIGSQTLMGFYVGIVLALLSYVRHAQSNGFCGVRSADITLFYKKDGQDAPDGLVILHLLVQYWRLVRQWRQLICIY